MKLKSINGKVPYIMDTGRDFVRDDMSQAAAERICANGRKTISKRFPDFPVCIDNKFYFAEMPTKSRKRESE